MYVSVKKSDVTDQNSAFFFVPSKSYSYLSISDIFIDSAAVSQDNPNLGMQLYCFYKLNYSDILITSIFNLFKSSIQAFKII